MQSSVFSNPFTQKSTHIRVKRNMASTTTSTPLSLSPITAGNKPPPRLPVQCAAPPPTTAAAQSYTATTRPMFLLQSPVDTIVSGRKIPRNVVSCVTGEAPAEVAEAPTETPEIVKTIQEAWEKVEDKYAVTSLAVAGGVVLWASAGMVSAIDRLPLVPGVLELVGIGYTGWFAYKKLVSKPEREELIQKVKVAYKDIIGTN